MPTVGDEDKEAMQVRLRLAEFSGGGVWRGGWGDESLVNVEIKQFQVYGQKGEEGISHMYWKYGVHLK